jgi:hypothetical protein
VETNATKQLARQRGLAYFEYAKKYLDRNDLMNARSAAEEGLMLTCGPFYLAVRDQLEDILDAIRTRIARQRSVEFGQSAHVDWPETTLTPAKTSRQTLSR